MNDLEKAIQKCFLAREDAISKYGGEITTITVVDPRYPTLTGDFIGTRSDRVEFDEFTLYLTEFCLKDKSCFKYCLGKPTKEDYLIANEFMTS